MRKLPRTRGFTLIELLVVIGIILLLVSIVVFGLRHVNATAARHETFAEMNILSGMLKEYESVNGLTNIEGAVGSANTPGSITPPALGTMSLAPPIYLDVDPPQANPMPKAPSFIVADDLAGGSSGDFGDRSAIGEPRYISPVIERTQAIMYILLKDPKNRTALAAVPTNRILEGPPNTSGGPAQLFPADYSIVLDGWGNPIIYVPRGGMVICMNPTNASTPQYYLVRSSGIFPCTDSKGSNNSTVPKLTNRDLPFFASAGQDGIFSDPAHQTDNGIDNIYSFQQ